MLRAAGAMRQPCSDSQSGRAMPQVVRPDDRVYHVLGAPLRPGRFYPGNENDAQGYREVHVAKRLEASGLQIIDNGDAPLPSYLPHHTTSPIRSWSGPHIAWDLVREHITSFLRQPGHVPLLLGCDCSMVVGATQALMGVAERGIQILHIDDSIDSALPQGAECLSAAAMGLWLITHESPFWNGPLLDPPQITIIGWHDEQGADYTSMGPYSFAQVREIGPREVGRRALALIADAAPILLHFDIDVLSKQVMPVRSSHDTSMRF
jgi:arginase